MKRIELIAPSHWMANLAAKSQVLKDRNIWTVMNPVPNVFNPRQNQNLNANVLKIGFVSENLNNPYKGLDVLLSAIRLIESKVKIELRLFGNGKVMANSIKSVVVQKPFKNEMEASEAYNSCDVIIVPSIQDNFPSVVTEALSCGIPVIGSNTGGISEVLKMFGLPIFEPGDSIALANLITNFESPENQNHYSKLANQHFSYKTSADKHESIYQEILRQ
jgi:glycosyltransferase involved in cell wall biosynthesis